MITTQMNYFFLKAWQLNKQNKFNVVFFCSRHMYNLISESPACCQNKYYYKSCASLVLIS